MMLKKKSSPWARLKYLYVLPLAAIAVAAFARPEISNELDEISAVKVNDLTAIMKADEVKSAETVSARPEKKIKVTGKVLDKEDKTPIVGASIIVVGTTNGTISDLDGNFVLEMEEEGKLGVSYINYVTKVVPVSADVKDLVVLLEEDGSDAARKPQVKFVPVEAEENPASEEVFQVVEKMPEFPGGMGECLKFLNQNIRYPVESQKAGVQGKVIVQFVVEADGSVTNPLIVRSIDPHLDGEAIRVISLMPQWKPGMLKGRPVRVKYTVPVAFRLDNENNLNVRMINIDSISADEPPLIIVDGQEVSQEIMKHLDPVKIESISVQKDLQMQKYGEKGKNGIILITTKKKQE